MILDSSAVIAILTDEPTKPELVKKLKAGGRLRIGAPTLVECYVVASWKLGPEAGAILERFLRSHEVEVVAFGREHYLEAAEAFRVYGKGRHPAGLNLGDCYSYATAMVAGEPLLYVGGDFALTPIAAA